MGRHVAVRKASATVAGARGGMVAGRTAGTGIGSAVGGAIGGALGSIIPGAGTAAGAALGSSLGGAAGGVAGGTAGGAIGGAGGAAVDAAKLGATGAKNLATGAKNVAVAGKNAAQTKIGEIGAKEVGTTAAGIAQNQANAQAAQSQQTMQNNIQSAKDTAQQAKDEAGIAKAWMFPPRMMHPEFKSYRDSIIERAKKAPRQDKDFRQDRHWNERMGHKEGRPEEARYIPNQHFEHENEVHNITPFQVAYATLQHMKENRLIDEDNHDAVALRELLHTDQPHPEPNQMKSDMAHIFSPVMDIRTMRGKSAHAQPFIDPKGAKTQHVYAQDVVKPDNLSFLSQEKVAVRPKSIVSEYMPGKRAKPSEEELIDSFIDTPTNKLQRNFGIEDNRLAGQEYIAQRKYEKEQAKQQATQQAQQEAQAKEEQFQQQPISVKQMGGMYFVTDPAYDYNGEMMDAIRFTQEGYDKYLDNDNKSEPMDLAWQMLFKAGIEVHHDEPLPQEFTQDITTLDRQHKMVPTENGTMIDNISPHMLRTIELMAQNHKDDNTITPKPFEMPTTFH